MPEFTGFPAEEITQDHIDGVRRSRELLETGKQFRAATREPLWRRNQDQYEGAHWVHTASEDPTADLITVNVSFSTVNTIIPYVTSEDPSFLVTPFSADASAKNARLQQAALNRVWRRAGGKPATKAAAYDYLIMGDGYLKPTWDIVEKTKQDASVTEIVEVGVDRVSPWDVWVDPFSTGVHDARWVCERFFMTRREFEKDDRYDQSMIDDIAWGQIEPDEDRDRGEKEVVHRDEQYTAIYEFYDRIDRVMYAFTEAGPENPASAASFRKRSAP